jgi:hypothetical protein
MKKSTGKVAIDFFIPRFGKEGAKKNQQVIWLLKGPWHLLIYIN